MSVRIKEYHRWEETHPFSFKRMRYPHFQFLLLTLLGQHNFITDAKKKIDAINHLREKEAKQKYFHEAVESKMPTFYTLDNIDINNKFEDLSEYSGLNKLTKNQVENLYHKNIISPVNKDGVVLPRHRLNSSAKAHVRTIDIDVSNMTQEEMIETIERVRRQRPNISPRPQSAPIRPTGRVIKEGKITPMPTKRPGLRSIKY